MKKHWFDWLIPGRSGWIERAAREGLDAYARETDGIPRGRTAGDAKTDSTGSRTGFSEKERTPSFA